MREKKIGANLEKYRRCENDKKKNKNFDDYKWDYNNIRGLCQSEE